jgi:pantoate ligase/cytidylate kinase
LGVDVTEIITTIAALRDYLTRYKEAAQVGSKTIGLVPTMGALHIGHLRLMKIARLESSCVVVSIFVNPLQFSANEDFDRYPRSLERDRQICEQVGVDVIFAPNAAEMGVENQQLTQVIPPEAMTKVMCGRSRVGHFQGVATIVCKLLNIVQPDCAYFGNKDGQQLAIIGQLVRDLHIPVKIVGCATVREPSGLAYSSRNQYLSTMERELAPQIYQGLQKAQQFYRDAIAKAEFISISAAAIVDASATYLANFPSINLEYIELVEAHSLQTCEEINLQSELMLAIAARIGNTRLIDNILLSPTNSRKPIIAIDGPAGAGKSTVTKRVAHELGLLFLDTGAMYRSITLAVLREGLDIRDQEQVTAIAIASKIQLFNNPIAGQPMQVLLNGEDITSAIRSAEVTANVSAIAAQPAVREILVKQQQAIGANGGVVMEGRDIGTHVFPDAEVKIFLTASARERANRRYADLIAQGQVPPDLVTLEQEISERDRQDSTRTHAPLTQAANATLVNTDGLSIDDVVATIVNLYEDKVQQP